MAISSKKTSNEGKGGLLIKIIHVGSEKLQVIMQCLKLVNVLNERVM